MAALKPIRTWTDINLSALERNISKIRAALPKNIRYIGAVKADAYGHGLPQIVKRMMHCGIDGFAVANVHEGSIIREMGSGWPILVLSPILPEEDSLILQYNLIPTISSLNEVNRYQALAKKSDQIIPVHLKIDTGMGRAGIWHTQADQVYTAIIQSSHLKLDGVFTHLKSADSNIDEANYQRSLFWQTLRRLNMTSNKHNLWIHADNSAGIESLEPESPINALRVGIAQYGISFYADSLLSTLSLDPVLSFHTKVTLTKELPIGIAIGYGSTYTLKRPTQISLIAAGYGDGLPRLLSNCGHVILHGRRCPIIGRVSMDQTMIDTTDLPTFPQPGDIVTLIGSQDSATITVSEFATWAQTIPYEILCSITKRVPRVYTQDTHS